MFSTYSKFDIWSCSSSFFYTHFNKLSYTLLIYFCKWILLIYFCFVVGI